MPRTRNSVGVVILKQIYSRLGHNYMGITIPTGIIEALDWVPGMMLQYYPTKDMGMKLVAVRDSIKDKEFEPRLAASEKPARGPRPGSFAEQQAHIDTRVAKMFDQLNAADQRLAAERAAKKTKPKPRRR